MCISSIIINNIHSLEPNKSFSSVFKHLRVNGLIKSFFPFHVYAACVFCLWSTVALFRSHKKLFQEYQFFRKVFISSFLPLGEFSIPLILHPHRLLLPVSDLHKVIQKDAGPKFQRLVLCTGLQFCCPDRTNQLAWGWLGAPAPSVCTS